MRKVEYLVGLIINTESKFSEKQKKKYYERFSSW